MIDNVESLLYSQCDRNDVCTGEDEGAQLRASFSDLRVVESALVSLVLSVVEG